VGSVQLNDNVKQSQDFTAWRQSTCVDNIVFTDQMTGSVTALYVLLASVKTELF